MNLIAALQIIDSLVMLASVAGNAVGEYSKISAIIAARIESGRTNWTEEEKAEVQEAMDAARAYALAELAKPDLFPEVKP